MLLRTAQQGADPFPSRLQLLAASNAAFNGNASACVKTACWQPVRKTVAMFGVVTVSATRKHDANAVNRSMRHRRACMHGIGGGAAAERTSE